MLWGNNLEGRENWGESGQCLRRRETKNTMCYLSLKSSLLSQYGLVMNVRKAAKNHWADVGGAKTQQRMWWSLFKYYGHILNVFMRSLPQDTLTGLVYPHGISCGFCSQRIPLPAKPLQRTAFRWSGAPLPQRYGWVLPESPETACWRRERAVQNPTSLPQGGRRLCSSI